MSYIGRYKNKAGKIVPSVTTVIKNIGWSTGMLMAWQNRLWEQGKDPRKASKEACDIGTLTHELIEHWIFGQDEYEPEEGVTNQMIIDASDGLNKYIKWSEDNNVEYLESEIRVVSEEYQYGGTADCIAKIDGEIVLIDFKTSKGVYDSHLVQLGAYKNVIEEQTGYKIDRCMVVRIAKGELAEGEERIQPHYIPNEIIETGWDTFKVARDLHEKNKVFGKYLRGLKKK